MNIDEILDEIIIIAEENMECRHDVQEPTYDTPGSHDIEYSLTEKGEEKLRILIQLNIFAKKPLKHGKKESRNE